MPRTTHHERLGWAGAGERVVVVGRALVSGRAFTRVGEGPPQLTLAHFGSRIAEAMRPLDLERLGRVGAAIEQPVAVRAAQPQIRELPNLMGSRLEASVGESRPRCGTVGATSRDAYELIDGPMHEAFCLSTGVR